MWVEFQGPLHQSSSINPLSYCQVEEDLWCEESDNHPTKLEEKATGGTVTSGGYVEVYSTPHAYDSGGEAHGEDSKRSPLLGLSNPQIRRIAGSGGIGCRVLHLFYGSVQTVCSAKGMGTTPVKSRGCSTRLRSDHLYASELCAHFGMWRCLHPVHVSCSFQVCLSLKLGFIAVIAVLSRRIQNSI